MLKNVLILTLLTVAAFSSSVEEKSNNTLLKFDENVNSLNKINLVKQELLKSNKYFPIVKVTKTNIDDVYKVYLKLDIEAKVAYYDYKRKFYFEGDFISDLKNNISTDVRESELFAFDVKKKYLRIFNDNLEDIMKNASISKNINGSKRYEFIMLELEGCEACKELNRYLYNDSNNFSFTMYSIFKNKNERTKKLIKKLRITSFPTVAVYDKKTKKIVDFVLNGNKNILKKIIRLDRKSGK